MWKQKNVSFMPPLSHSWVTFWPGGRWRPRVSKTAPAFSSVCQFPQVIHKKLQPSPAPLPWFASPKVPFTWSSHHLVGVGAYCLTGLIPKANSSRAPFSPTAEQNYDVGNIDWDGCAEWAQWITAVIHRAHWVIQGSCATQEWEGQ